MQWEALRRKCVASLLALALAMTALLSPSAAFAEPDRGGIFGGFFNQSSSTPTATVTMENKVGCCKACFTQGVALVAQAGRLLG